MEATTIDYKIAYEELLVKYQRLEEAYEELQEQIKCLLRKQYGRKSEKHNKPTIANTPTISNKHTETVPLGRQRLPSHLPRERIEYDLPEAEKQCDYCHQPLKQIGEEMSEQLDYVPAQLKVKQHVRLKYACAYCQQTIKLADKPEQPITKGLASARLLAHVIVSKYADHLPLHRQEDIFARHGIHLSRSTLCDWVSSSAELITPIVGALHKDVLCSEKVHTDDTPVPVIEKGKGQTHRGYLWVYIGQGENKPTRVVYDYTRSRSQKGPETFLVGYEGYLQADAYAGYNVLYEQGSIIEVGCWSHARRKFYDVWVNNPASKRAEKALSFIKQLYEIEERLSSVTRQERMTIRQEQSKPVLEELKGWLDIQAADVLPKSPLGKAIAYTLNQWQSLTCYIMDGILAIDNNISERAIKPLVIGRRNWTFAGSHQGAKNAALFYSLIQTCKHNQIEPYAYLVDILERTPTHKINRIHELAPYNWKAPPDADQALQKAA